MNAKTEKNVERESCSAESVLPQALEGLENNEQESYSDEEGVQISRSSFDKLGAMMFGFSWSTSMKEDGVRQSRHEEDIHNLFRRLHLQQTTVPVSEWISKKDGLSDF